MYLTEQLVHAQRHRRNRLGRNVERTYARSHVLVQLTCVLHRQTISTVHEHLRDVRQQTFVSICAAAIVVVAVVVGCQRL